MAERVLTLRELNRATLARQLLLERAALPMAEAIARVAGLQAQLPNPPYVGLWARLRGFQRVELTRQIETRQVVRAALRPELQVYRDARGAELLDVPGMPLPDEDVPAPVRFLPEYDNLLLAHVDRSRVVPQAYRGALYLTVGRVRATFLVDGFVAGTWRVERERGTARLIVEPLKPLTHAAREALAEEGEALLRFIADDAETHAVRFAETS